MTSGPPLYYLARTFGRNQYGAPPRARECQRHSTRVSESAGGGIAKALSYPTKGRMVLTDHGDYVMPVHLTVTLLP